jgi:hypothetical protein
MRRHVDGDALHRQCCTANSHTGVFHTLGCRLRSCQCCSENPPR